MPYPRHGTGVGINPTLGTGRLRVVARRWSVSGKEGEGTGSDHRPLPDGVGAPVHLNLSFFDLPTNTNVSGERFNGEIVAVESECEDGFLIWDLDPQFFRYRAVASIR